MAGRHNHPDAEVRALVVPKIVGQNPPRQHDDAYEEEDSEDCPYPRFDVCVRGNRKMQENVGTKTESRNLPGPETEEIDFCGDVWENTDDLW